MPNMPKITYAETSGVRHTVEVSVGESLMQGARNQGVAGIVAECGGSGACATCRVIVDGAWSARVPPAGPLEELMLDALEERQMHERLSCQIICTEDLDGLIVLVAANHS